MADPIQTEAPDDSGSGTVRRFEYQIHISVQAVLEMLAGGTVTHVTCEHIEDIVVALPTELGQFGTDGLAMYDPRPGDPRRFDRASDTS